MQDFLTGIAVAVVGAIATPWAYGVYTRITKKILVLATFQEISGKSGLLYSDIAFRTKTLEEGLREVKDAKSTPVELKNTMDFLHKESQKIQEFIYNPRTCAEFFALFKVNLTIHNTGNSVAKDVTIFEPRIVCVMSQSDESSSNGGIFFFNNGKKTESVKIGDLSPDQTVNISILSETFFFGDPKFEDPIRTLNLVVHANGERAKIQSRYGNKSFFQNIFAKKVTLSSVILFVALWLIINTFYKDTLYSLIATVLSKAE
ncbi:hypothetical protein [Thalassobaculum sp.]|uniref:hypothetical protein n=1 Tax=Thalassobaculum sp. TaxID=2022740 RepID=UPI003B5C83E7